MYNLDWKNQEQYTKKEIDKSLGPDHNPYDPTQVKEVEEEIKGIRKKHNIPEENEDNEFE